MYGVVKYHLFLKWTNILINLLFKYTSYEWIKNKIPKIKVEDGSEIETVDLYDFKQGLWISKISMTLIGNKMITNSNHFINLLNDTNDTGQEDGNYPIKENRIKFIQEL